MSILGLSTHSVLLEKMSLSHPGPSTASLPGPLTTHPADPLSVVLDKMKQLEQRMEAMLKQLEEQMYRSQDEVMQKDAKKAKQERTLTFKKKGHQEQHEFKECFCKCLEEVREYCKSGNFRVT